MKLGRLTFSKTFDTDYWAAPQYYVDAAYRYTDDPDTPIRKNNFRGQGMPE